ncbi:MAG TPA: hypothetical protein PLY68_05665 [Myxococcota bacterium]|nr:hypothetical protein [Myxococcota bacterium]
MSYSGHDGIETIVVSVDNPGSWVWLSTDAAINPAQYLESAQMALDELRCVLGRSGSLAASSLPGEVFSPDSDPNLADLTGFLNSGTGVSPVIVCYQDPDDPRALEVADALRGLAIDPAESGSLPADPEECLGSAGATLTVNRAWTGDCVYRPVYTVRYVSEGMVRTADFPAREVDVSTRPVRITVAFVTRNESASAELPNMVPQSMFLRDLSVMVRRFFGASARVTIEVVGDKRGISPEDVFEVKKGAPERSLSSFNSAAHIIDFEGLASFLMLPGPASHTTDELRFFIGVIPDDSRQMAVVPLLSRRFGQNWQLWRYDGSLQSGSDVSGWQSLEVDESGRINVGPAIDACEFGMDFQVFVEDHDETYWPFDSRELRICANRKCDPASNTRGFASYVLTRLGFRLNYVSQERMLGTPVIYRESTARVSHRHRGFRVSCQDLADYFAGREAFVVKDLKGRVFPGNQVEVFFRPCLSDVAVRFTSFTTGGTSYMLDQAQNAPVFRNALIGGALDGIEIALSIPVFSEGMSAVPECRLNAFGQSRSIGVKLVSTPSGPDSFSVHARNVLKDTERAAAAASDWVIECSIRDRDSKDKVLLLSQKIPREIDVSLSLNFASALTGEGSPDWDSGVHACGDLLNLLTDETLTPYLVSDAGLPMTQAFWDATGCSAPSLSISVVEPFSEREKAYPLEMVRMSDETFRRHGFVWTIKVPNSLRQDLASSVLGNLLMKSVRVVTEGCATYVEISGSDVCSDSSMPLPAPRVGVIPFRFNQDTVTEVGHDSIESTISDLGLGVKLRAGGEGEKSGTIGLSVRGGVSHYATNPESNAELAWLRVASVLTTFFARTIRQVASPDSVVCRWSDDWSKDPAGVELPESAAGNVGQGELMVTALESRVWPLFRACVEEPDVQDTPWPKSCLSKNLSRAFSSVRCSSGGIESDFGEKSILKPFELMDVSIQVSTGNEKLNPHRAQFGTVCVQTEGRMAGFCEGVAVSGGTEQDRTDR